MRQLYDKMVNNCNLGDWDLGYRAVIQREDGLAALIEMCGAVGRSQPVLAWAALMCCIQQPDGSGINFSRYAHVLTKVAQRCAPFSPGAGEQACFRHSHMPTIMHLRTSTYYSDQESRART